MAAFSTLGLSNFATIKLLAIAGTSWLAGCVALVARKLNCDGTAAFLLTLLLPTAMANGVVLGQCDALWVGASVLAVIAAITNRPITMAGWAGVAFCFKAQAAFLAPLYIGLVLRKRAWWAVPTATVVFIAAMLPAAIAGWPWSDLLTIYLRQPAFTFIGDAPNLWAIPRALGVGGPSIFPVGYLLGGSAALVLMFATQVRKDILSLALLSAVAIPFFLPKMLERYFFLADILSLVAAYSQRDRRTVVIAGLIQSGSFLSIVAYLADSAWLNGVASLPMAIAPIELSSSVFFKQFAVVADSGIGRSP